MNKPRQFFIITLSLITMLLSSVLMPQALYAEKGEESGTGTLVEYTGTEEDLKALLAELKGLNVKIAESTGDELSLPASGSWTSKEMSPKQLADLVQEQLVGPCFTIRFRVTIPTPWGRITRIVSVRVCLE